MSWYIRSQFEQLGLHNRYSVKVTSESGYTNYMSVTTQTMAAIAELLAADIHHCDDDEKQ